MSQSIFRGGKVSGYLPRDNSKQENDSPHDWIRRDIDSPAIANTVLVVGGREAEPSQNHARVSLLPAEVPFCEKTTWFSPLSVLPIDVACFQRVKDVPLDQFPGVQNFFDDLFVEIFGENELFYRASVTASPPWPTNANKILGKELLAVPRKGSMCTLLFTLPKNEWTVCAVPSQYVAIDLTNACAHPLARQIRQTYKKYWLLKN